MMNNSNFLFLKYFKELEQLSEGEMDGTKQDRFCELSGKIELILDGYVKLETEINSLDCPLISHQMNLNFFENYITPLLKFQNNLNTLHFLRQRIQNLRIRQVEKQLFLEMKSTCPIKKIIDYTLYNKEYLFSRGNDLLIQQILDEYRHSFEYTLYKEIQNLAGPRDRIYSLHLGSYFQDMDIGKIDSISAIELKNNVLFVYSKFLKINDENRLLNAPTNFKRLNELKEKEFIQVAQEFFQLEIIFEKRNIYSFNDIMAMKLLTIFQTNNPISELDSGDFLIQFNSIIANLVTIDLLFLFISELVNEKYIRENFNNKFYTRFDEIVPLPVGKDAIKKYVDEPTKIIQRILKNLDENKLVELKKGAVKTLQGPNKNKVITEILKKIKNINNY